VQFQSFIESENAMNFPPKIASLALLSSLSLVAIATPASALTFTKLVEVGQKVPGNDLPVTAIVEPTIGLDGQVAVKLTTQTVTTPTAQKAFSGIYAIPKGGSLKLLEGGVELVDQLPTGIFSAINLTEPYISGGKIAYGRSIVSYDATGKQTSQSDTIRVGTPGNVKTTLTLPSTITFRTTSVSNSRAFVNGKFYFLSAASVRPTGGRFPLLNLNVVDTQAASPSITILDDNSNRYNIGVHASANTIALEKIGSSRVITYESSGDANFKPIFDCPTASVSHESIVFLCNDGSRHVRFGRQGKIFPLPLSDSAAGIKITPLVANSAASISNRSVLYLQDTRDSNGNGALRLYLSTNGQTPITLLKTGDRLSGKTVDSMGLNFTGRTLAGNFAVCVVQFTDNSQALYRIDL
jgi:hypothetical protein